MIAGSALLSLAALFAVQSMSQDGSALQPASETAILTGGKACIGATVDPAGQDGRLAGWTSNVPLPANTHTEGRVVGRDNVMLVVETGIDGGCVVQAKADAAFDKAKFFADLSAVAGVPIDPTKPKTDLPNGELIVVQIGGEGAASFVQLVIANPNGKHLKHTQGN